MTSNPARERTQPAHDPRRKPSLRLVAILAAVTAFIFARNHILAALAIPLHNRIAHASRRLAAILLLGPDLDASYRICAATHRPLP